MQLSTNKILGCDFSLQSVYECGFSLVLLVSLLSERAKSLTDDVDKIYPYMLGFRDLLISHFNGNSNHSYHLFLI